MTVQLFLITLFSWLSDMNHTLKVEGHMFMSISTNAKLFNILGLLFNKSSMNWLHFILLTWWTCNCTGLQGYRTIATNGLYNQLGSQSFWEIILTLNFGFWNVSSLSMQKKKQNNDNRPSANILS